MTTNRTVAQRLASLVEARANCIRFEHYDWLDRHEATIRAIVDECLPRGAGFDAGCQLVLETESPLRSKVLTSTGERLVIVTSFHHMNQDGYYDGWTDMTVIVTPTFGGINVDVRGKDRDGIFDYAAEVFHHALTQPAPREIIEAA